MPVERPANWQSNGQHLAHRSAQTSPVTSRRNSTSSVASARSEPGLMSDNSRTSSSASATSVASSKSGFKSLFGKKTKSPHEKKNTEKIVLTSKHAAAVQTKLAMDSRLKTRPQAKTAGIVQSVHTGHLSAAEQEARHPHSGPPALHALGEMPLLTRIVSGDEQDEEDELTRLDRARAEWDVAKLPSFSQIREHESDNSNSNSNSSTPSPSPPLERSSSDEGWPSRRHTLSPNIESALAAQNSYKPLVNSYGGRFHQDERGHWTR